MSFGSAFKMAEKFAIDNSPAILTAIGVVGTVSTAYLTAKASFKAADLLFEEENRVSESVVGAEPKSRKELAKMIAPLYIPAGVTCVVTISCIIGANRVGSKRAAAMAAAYSLSEKALAEYKEKVVEKLGENKARAIRDEIAQDRVNANPQSESNVIIMGNGDVPCYDMYTGRYFNSSVDAIKAAMNDTNHQINTNGYASLQDFYDRVGLPRTSNSDEIGWNGDKLLEIDFSAVLGEDGRPCMAYDFRTLPLARYHRVH